MTVSHPDADPSLDVRVEAASADLAARRICVPLDRRRVMLWSAALALLLTAYFAVPFPWPTNRFDTGIPLVAADRILAGELPYVDFQTLYTPGYYYLVAAAWSVFGRSFDVYHAVSTGVGLVNILLAFLVAWRLARTPLRAGVAVLAGLAAAYPYPALAPALLALIVAADGPKLSGRRVLIAGALAGLAGWFRHDIGAAATVALMAAVWTRARLADDSDTGLVPRAFTLRVLRLPILAGCAATGVLLLLLSPALVLAPGRLLEGLVLNPLATVPFRQGSRSLVEGLLEFGATGPVFVACALLTLFALVVAVVPRRAARWLDPQVPVGLLVGVGVLGLYALRYFVLRPETHHILPATLMLGILGAVRWRGSLRWLSLGRWVWIAVLVCLFVPVYRAAGSRASQALGRRSTRVTAVGEFLPGADHLYLPNQELSSYRALLKHLDRTVPPGQPLFSACERHDVIHDQDLLLYFLAQRPAVVFDHHFDPGVTTRAEVQRGIVADLVAHDVRTIVRFRSRLPASAQGAMPGSRILDTWIEEHFSWGATFGRYQVWERD